jgi:formate hydrogenlyase subunit 4
MILTSANLVFIVTLTIMPFLLIGVIKKIKACFQNRVGPPVFQSLYNLVKLFNKDEILSKDCSWIFRSGPLISFSGMLLLCLSVPWLPLQPPVPGCDIFLFVYVLALIRFFSIISSIDAGSPFSSFAASREATLSFLAEPAFVLALVALGISAHSSDLALIFGQPIENNRIPLSVWFFSGVALFLSGIVELSRMPIDDPSTHLELTMVHEAMVIENSGPNLALVEWSYALKLLLFFGLIAQCFVYSLSKIIALPPLLLPLSVLVVMLALGCLTAMIESFSVKLSWGKNPDFIAYAVSMSLLSSLAAFAMNGGS